ncbi:MAG: DUF4129 domain-containing protein [Planctomycetota bacterium]|nr:DUF4129 domain-containing protein [Planctomycetota bacterium]MDP6761290.1 DUF4129 domain-containing protein [Planctomycetota bacterium]MDP6990818.1 DUF4129 domain-containing protein [Planctomycetota bacterium]
MSVHRAVFQGAEPERVHALVREILAGEAYARERERSTWLADLVEWLGDLFDWQPSPGSVSLAMDAVRIALGVAGAAAGVWLFVLLGRHLRERWERTGTQGTGAALDRRVAKLRAAAAAAQGRGDRIEALRLYFFALVVGLGERGELRYRESWTPRELLARGELRPAVHAALTPLMADLDAHSFGRRPAGEDDVRRYAELCSRLLGPVGEEESP